ncbi:MAG TPA: GDSL-type esterase/lipase family protein [Candidatus Paceibacterota bacterium]
MNKTIFIILGVLAVGVIAFFLFKKDMPEITNYPPRTGPIVVLGDSLVYGAGSTRGNDFVSVLSNEIGEPVINMGVNGNTTADGLARVDTVLALNPRVVVVLLGGNDFLRRVPMNETFENLDAIVEKLQANGAVVVLLGIQGGLLNDPFAAQFEALAERRGTAYVPNVLSGLIGNQSLMADAIHPNDEGYKRVAEKVLPVLQAVLK